MESTGRFEKKFFKLLREDNIAGAGGAFGDGPSTHDITKYAEGDGRLPKVLGRGEVQTRNLATGSKKKKKKKKKKKGVDYATGEESEEDSHPGYEDTTWSDGKLTITMQEVEEELAKQGFPDPKGGIEVDILKDLVNREGTTLDIHTRHKPNKTPKEVKKTSDRAERADLKYSIIVSVKDGVYVEVLDGNHRLHKAMELIRRDDENASDTINVRPLDLSKVPGEWRSVFG